MMSEPYNSETLSEYIDDFMNDNDVINNEETLVLESKMANNDKSKMVDNDENISNKVDTESDRNDDIADEEIVHVEAIHEVEATPFFPDISPVPISSPEGTLFFFFIFNKFRILIKTVLSHYHTVINHFPYRKRRKDNLCY